MDNNLNQNRRNLLKQNYLSSHTNYVICIDHSQLGQQGHLFCAIDLPSRNIVGHCFKDKPFQSFDVVDTLKKIIEETSFLPNIQIIHSDRESLFRNIHYEQFLESNQIKITIGSAEAHSNQVIERCFRTLKNIIRRDLNPLWKEGQPDPLEQNTIDYNKIKHIVKNSIEFYNDKPHKGILGMSPNRMEQALFIHSQSIQLVDKVIVPPLAKNDNSAAAKQIILFKNQAIENFQGNWVQFFKDFRDETKKGFQSIEEQNTVLLSQNHNLYIQNLQLTKSLGSVKKEIDFMREERERKQLLKDKRINDCATRNNLLRYAQSMLKRYKYERVSLKVSCFIY